MVSAIRHRIPVCLPSGNLLYYSENGNCENGSCRYTALIDICEDYCEVNLLEPACINDSDAGAGQVVSPVIDSGPGQVVSPIIDSGPGPTIIINDTFGCRNNRHCNGRWAR